MAVSASADIASALWYCGPGKAEIRREEIAPPGAGEVRVKTLYSAISRGTRIPGVWRACTRERIRANARAVHGG